MVVAISKIQIRLVILQPDTSSVLLTENIQDPVIFFDVVDSMKFVVDSSTSDHLHVVGWVGGEPGNKLGQI